MSAPPWLSVTQGKAPLIVSMPHTGSDIPGEMAPRFVSPWLARKDADWWIERLYDFASGLGATLVRTTLSRSVIDANRDPSGRSLYPGQNTTELCPTTTFDGEPLYREGCAPDAEEIARRRAQFFDPYHAALAGEIARLRARHAKIVLFEAHSIRSRIPRLFDGELPHFNLGTNSGLSCAPALAAAIERACDGDEPHRPPFPPPHAGEVRPQAGEGGVEPTQIHHGGTENTENTEEKNSALRAQEDLRVLRASVVRDSPLRRPPPALRATSPACGGGKASAGGGLPSIVTRVTDGRFKGGFTTRHYGDPARGVHAVQLELAMRGYMDEPAEPSAENWPSPYDALRAAPLRAVLQRILETCLSFASEP